MNMRILYILAIFIPSFCFGQSPEQLRDSIIKQIKESLNQNPHINSWVACNKDSGYYVRDTIYFYNKLNYSSDPSHCCSFVEWDFESNSSFRDLEKLMCQEPPLGIARVNNLNRLKWKIDNNKLYLIILNRLTGTKERFQILNYSEKRLWNMNQKAYVLKLLRIKTYRK